MQDNTQRSTKSSLVNMKPDRRLVHLCDEDAIKKLSQRIFELLQNMLAKANGVGWYAMLEAGAVHFWPCSLEELYGT